MLVFLHVRPLEGSWEDLTKLWLQPPQPGCILQVFSAHGKAMIMPLGMVSGVYPWGHREHFLSVWNHELFWMVLLLWRRASTSESLLWLPDMSLCALLCFISSLSSMCVYSRVFLMDFSPTNTWEDWWLKGCLDFLSNVVMSLAILSNSENCCPLCLKVWGCRGTSDLLMASFQLPPHLKKI